VLRKCTKADRKHCAKISISKNIGETREKDNKRTRFNREREIGRREEAEVREKAERAEKETK
jgi:hypothetical protein